MKIMGKIEPTEPVAPTEPAALKQTKTLAPKMTKAVAANALRGLKGGK
jgi:hypothetical protein